MSQNQPSFNGTFQDILNGGYNKHCYPVIPLSGCPYSDRLMMKTLRKIMSSNKATDTINVILEDTKEGKAIIFETSPKIAKKFLPKLVQLFEGNFVNLTNPVFWKILKHKKTEVMKYRLPKSDYVRMLDYFGKPKTRTEVLTGRVADRKIVKKTNKFKLALYEAFKAPEKQHWLNEFFNV